MTEKEIHLVLCHLPELARTPTIHFLFTIYDDLLYTLSIGQIILLYDKPRPVI